MANVIIKTDDRKVAESTTLREYGISPENATQAQREFAEHITANERDMRKDFNRMEEKSR
jgi:hypothetical protein